MHKFWKILFVVAAYAMLAYVLSMDVTAQQASIVDALEKTDMSLSEINASRAN